MAIPYVVKKRTITVGREPSVKYVLLAQNRATLSQEDFIARVANASTIEEGDVQLVIDTLAFLVEQQAKNGRKVKFPQFGTFYPSISVKAMRNAEDVSDRTIKDRTIKFLPDAKLKTEVSKAKLKPSSLNTLKKVVQ